jgi:hypothetical protein
MIGRDRRKPTKIGNKDDAASPVSQHAKRSWRNQ